MTTIWIAFLISFVLSIVATRVVVAIAWRLGLTDRPDGIRKLHARETPRLGGIAIFTAFAAPLVGLLLFPHLSQVSRGLALRETDILIVLVGAGLTLVLGVFDDLLDVRAGWKLLAQVIIASAVVAAGFRISAVSNPFGEPLLLGIFAFPVSVFWFVGCMNAVNLLDGLDGLAAGMCLFVTMTLFLVSLQFGNTLGMFLMAAFSGSIMGFLIFNFPPARIFLGDCGSMVLGFLIAALSLVGTSRKAETAVALFIPVIALGLPIVDTSIAIFRRWYKRLPVSSPDRQHIHHVLVSMGYSQRRAVLTLYAICVVLGGAALLITFARNEVVLFVIGALIVTAFVSMRIFSGVRLTDMLDKLAEDASRRKVHAHASAIVDEAVRTLRMSQDLEEVWPVLVLAFERLGVASAGLSVSGAQGMAPAAWSWESDHERVGGKDPSGRDHWSTRMYLRRQDDVFGELTMAKAMSDGTFVPEMAEVMRRLRDEVEIHIVRILWHEPA